MLLSNGAIVDAGGFGGMAAIGDGSVQVREHGEQLYKRWCDWEEWQPLYDRSRKQQACERGPIRPKGKHVMAGADEVK